jgi:NADPH:quinone reductase-like Zn-dependent oxidoreductase
VLGVTEAVLRQGGRHASIVDAAAEEKGGLHIWVRPNGKDLQKLADLADAGKLTVPVAQTFPLEAAADALVLSMTGRVRGKVAISVSR